MKLFYYFLSGLFFIGCCFSQEKAFAVLVTSFNNENIVQRNITSILNQKYSNFRVFYINDCSTDQTLKKLSQTLANHPKKDLVTIIDNTKNLGGLANYYYTIHDYIADDEIVVCLDGDDLFYDSYVLSYLNNIYNNCNIWLTYGQFVFLSNNKVGWNTAVPLRVIKSNSYREFQHVPTHLRTFYAWLFKKIKPEDLKWKEDEFFPTAWDMAFMFPMLEMSGGKFKFIRRPTYIYNDTNPLNDHKKDEKLQREIAAYIRNMAKYTPL